jgi:3,5-dioxohexanoate:acetyl-CoA acetone transferase
MANKIIISCAITGSIHTLTMSDALPITPIPAEARAAGFKGDRSRPLSFGF